MLGSVDIEDGPQPVVARSQTGISKTPTRTWKGLLSLAMPTGRHSLPMSEPPIGPRSPNSGDASVP